MMIGIVPVILGAIMQGQRVGRQSRHPIQIRYHEDLGVHALMQAAVERDGLTFAEFQRTVNRAGLRALNILAEVG